MPTVRRRGTQFVQCVGSLDKSYLWVEMLPPETLAKEWTAVSEKEGLSGQMLVP